MKFLTISFIPVVALFSCNQARRSERIDLGRIDSLESKLAEMYKPGLGEFMSQIQAHHAKLWFAGQNQNWKLADFEVNELKESFLGIKKYCSDRAEIKDMIMMDSPLDSVDNAIRQKDFLRFKRSYVLVTNTCNSCHQATSHEFNVIKIPDRSPFGNQDFKVK